MKTEYKIFAIVTAFLFVACGVYAWWTNHAYDGHTEYIGVVALFLSALLCLMCAGYFWFVSRRIDPRPEDRDEADIAEGAGEIGFFSPGSYYPLGLALSVLLAGIGLIYVQWWIFAAGAIAILIAVGGFLFEYYTGSRKSH